VEGFNSGIEGLMLFNVLASLHSPPLEQDCEIAKCDIHETRAAEVYG
jgi:hypothetical protein